MKKIYVLFIFFFVKIALTACSLHSIFPNFFQKKSTIYDQPNSPQNLFITKENQILYQTFRSFLAPTASISHLQTHYYWSLMMEATVPRNFTYLKCFNIACLKELQNCADFNMLIDFRLAQSQEYHLILLTDDIEFKENYEYFSFIHVLYIERFQNEIENYFLKNCLNLVPSQITTLYNFQHLIPDSYWNYNQTILYHNGVSLYPLAVSAKEYMIYQKMSTYFLEDYNNETHFSNAQRYFLSIPSNLLSSFNRKIGDYLFVFLYYHEKKYINQNLLVIDQNRKQIQTEAYNNSKIFLKQSYFIEDFKYGQWVDWGLYEKNTNTIFHFMHQLKFYRSPYFKKNLLIGIFNTSLSLEMELFPAIESACSIFKLNTTNREFVIIIPKKLISVVKEKFPEYPIIFYPISDGELNGNIDLFNIGLVLASQYLTKNPIYHNVIFINLQNSIIQNDPFHYLPQNHHFLAGIKLKNLNLNIDQLTELKQTGGNVASWRLSFFERISDVAIAGDMYSIILLSLLLNMDIDVSSQLLLTTLFHFNSELFAMQAYPNGFLFYEIIENDDLCNIEILNNKIHHANWGTPSIIFADRLTNIKDNSCVLKLVNFFDKKLWKFQDAIALDENNLF